ncbi:hypothetical protein BJF85_18295 [Saccharomonospora sp. CUA-673]|uniref:oxygenase MpaB family protein n=1 Tax=Saccharomonospora sp. CUA-673 TaxID=1904969 RepID=UPI000968836A|nr:oxygenase MpaB family protein [Saccharomonospora sp. CUA-673]OLT45924.1 hypothetical protein BJF85_18295 [Saccharomonospora sp. CUA-673]
MADVRAGTRNTGGHTGDVVKPHADAGFFGPGSVAWKVWLYPTAMLHGFIRATVIEELDPYLVASVDHSGQVKQRPALRYDRTMQYFATVMFADAKTVLDSAELLVKIHSRAIGPEPVTGGQYDANDPDSQLWIHMTAWHSILYTYEMFGPGKLSEAEEAEYWEACAIAAAFQTIDPEAVPRSRDEVRRYFEDWRPRLAGTEVAQDMMDFILYASQYLVPKPVPKVLRRVVSRFVGAGVKATMPHWMRKIGATPQSRVMDSVIIALTRPVMRLMARGNRKLQLDALRRITPRSAPVIAPALLEVPPTSPKKWTPAEAYEHFEMTTPRKQYEAVRDAKREPYRKHHHEPVLEFQTTPAGKAS